MRCFVFSDTLTESRFCVFQENSTFLYNFFGPSRDSISESHSSACFQNLCQRDPWSIKRARSRQHSAERFQTLAHLAKRNYRTSVIALGFHSGEQLPRLVMDAAHSFKKAVTQPLVADFGRLDHRL
jgi:hypothetical protein